MFLKNLTFSLCLSLCCALPLNAAPRDVSHSTDAELRMEYLDKLLNSRSGQHLSTHNGGVTKLKVDEMLSQARAAIAAGNHDEADALAKRAFKMMMDAVRELPDHPEEVARFKHRYEDMHRGVEKFTYAQEDTSERYTEEAAQNSYDTAEVARLLKQAEALAGKEKYQDAIALLADAQNLVTASLQGLLNHKKLVIKLDIGTPEKEYYYELRRYLGHAELIPIAIDVKKPNAMASELMLEFSKKAEWMSEQARQKAIEQDYPVAIRMMMDATKTVKQALRLVGVAI